MARTGRSGRARALCHRHPLGAFGGASLVDGGSGIGWPPPRVAPRLIYRSLRRGHPGFARLPRTGSGRGVSALGAGHRRHPPRSPPREPMATHVAGGPAHGDLFRPIGGASPAPPLLRFGSVTGSAHQPDRRSPGGPQYHLGGIGNPYRRHSSRSTGPAAGLVGAGTGSNRPGMAPTRPSPLVGANRRAAAGPFSPFASGGGSGRRLGLELAAPHCQPSSAAVGGLSRRRPG